MLTLTVDCIRVLLLFEVMPSYCHGNILLILKSTVVFLMILSAAGPSAIVSLCVAFMEGSRIYFLFIFWFCIDRSAHPALCQILLFTSFNYEWLHCAVSLLLLSQ